MTTKQEQNQLFFLIQLSFLLKWLEIKARYRRSSFGLLWEMLSFGAYVGVVSAIWSLVLKIPFIENFTNLVVVFSGWRLAFNAIYGATQEIIEANNALYKNYSAASSLPQLNCFFGSLLQFCASVPLFLIALIYNQNLDFQIEYFLALCFCFPALYMSLKPISYACAINADLRFMIQTALNFVMLISPVLWPISMLGDNWIIMLLNPFAIFIIIFKSAFIHEVNLVDFQLVAIALVFWFALIIILHLICSKFDAKLLKLI